MPRIQAVVSDFKFLLCKKYSIYHIYHVFILNAQIRNRINRRII